MSLKLQLTNELAQKLHMDPTELFKRMWASNRRADSGYKLTKYGFDQLSKIKQNWKIKTDISQVRSIDLIRLDRFLETPYYLRPKSMSVFDDGILVQITLYGNDIPAFLHGLDLFADNPTKYKNQG